MKTKLIQKIKKEWEEFKDRYSLNDECNVHSAWDFWIYRYKKAISQSKEELMEKIKKALPTHSVTWTKDHINEHLLSRNEVKRFLEDLNKNEL